ncbi:hypothetical protein B0H16DRAFT_1607271 [Mycena metata]|uniref:Uncharacterized protein n=1 Tax=Mycena metata TaxID=1033252 RepID=A0AAD7HFE8_9AGAR|nr:hypothetical protein B0H16DRAFT_1607271 [Mycena metata]
MACLPPELQREILEIAIRINSRDAAVKLHLSLVAHRFHSWVDQVFYESVTIGSSQSADKFLKLVDMTAKFKTLDSKFFQFKFGPSTA